MSHHRAHLPMRSRSGNRLVLLASLAGLAMLSPRPAFAECHFDIGNTVTITFSVPAAIAVPRDTPVSTAFYTSPSTPFPGSQSVTCSSGEIQQVVNDQGSQAGPNLPIGNTGMAWQWVYTSGSYNGLLYGSAPAAGSWSFTGTSHGLRLVRIGPIAPGAVIPAGPIGEFRYGSLVSTRMVLDKPIVLTESACSTADVSVNMGNRRANEFAGPGTAAPSTSFNIALNNCPRGLAGITYQLDAATSVVDAAQSVIALVPSSTATGIAVQLLSDSGTPIGLGTPHAFAGYASSVGGNYTIPLRARYYQVSSPIGGGSANAAAVFTMNYH